MTPLAPERRIAWCVALVIIALNVYYAHRWLLRYNDAGTSPTYETTPFAWQAGKYVLIAVAAGAMWVWLWWRARSEPPVWQLPYLSTGGFAPLLAGFGGYGVLVILSTVRGAPHVRELVTLVAALPVVLLVPAASLTSVSLDIYRRAGFLLIAYHAAFTAVQVGAYLGWDRLPALAYAGGLVRFGGGLDDPNGFGIMVVLPILLTITMWREFHRRVHAAILLAALATMAFLTLSFSTAAALVAGLLALSPIMRRPRILLGVVGGVVIAGGVALTSGYVRGVIDAKSRSAWGRLDLHGTGTRPGLADHLGEFDVVAWVFGAPRSNVVTEIGYVEVFANFGVIGLGLLVALLVIAVRRGVTTAQVARQVGDLPVARLYEGLSAYLVAFAVGSLGIPYFGVMPVNVVFWLVAILAALGPHLLSDRTPAG